MSLMTMTDLLKEELEDLLSAETQIEKALPKMINAAASNDLRSALEEHLMETHGQIKRLHLAMDKMGMLADSKVCKGMAGLIAEGEDILAMDGDRTVKDVALISAAQRVEHYEIAAYGCACTYADSLGLDDIHELLGETLEEEKETDAKLTKLATGGMLGHGINEDAKKR